MNIKDRNDNKQEKKRQRYKRLVKEGLCCPLSHLIPFLFGFVLNVPSGL